MRIIPTTISPRPGGRAAQNPPPGPQPADPAEPPGWNGGQFRILKSKKLQFKNEATTQNVKYIYDIGQRREKYQVEIGATLRRRGQEFDTYAVKKQFIDKGKAAQFGNASLGDHRQPVGDDRKPTPFETPRDWARESLIWVCASDPDTNRPAIYSHVGKLHRFHHSSLVAGDDVIGAGEWIVRKGKLRKISANSGHYQPTMDYFYNAVLHMAAAFQSDTVVFLYDQIDDEWVEIPVRDFIQRPSDGGPYKTHPRPLG